MDGITLQSKDINEIRETNDILSLSQRRKIIFIYNDTKTIKQSFEWCLKNLFQYGQDYITIIDLISSNPSTKGFNFYDLWDLTAGTDGLIKFEILDIAEFETKTKTKNEIIDIEIQALRHKLRTKQILSQKISITSVDPRAQLLQLINTQKPEFIIIPKLETSLLHRTIYGSLEDYLLQYSNCSVFVIKEKEHLY
ncbi:hypothetical protein K502DRAFT_367817 [Neoconidiobolus thromboides FSU 785]|nr:hypothetical protein K502DRAFT_367817 [Neoconidiobolus thromboides FSU 785]